MAQETTHTNGTAQTFSDIVRERHSTRAYKSDPVPRALLEECFQLAQTASSNSNLQPWRVTVVEGDALIRLEKTLLEAVDAGVKPEIAPIPAKYKKYRSEMGHSLYGPNGYNIPRGAREQMEAARRRNYTFFDAPVGMIVSLDNMLAPVDVFSVGLYVQTLVLLLQERGISHCIEVSVAGYPREIRKELGIPEEMDILCGIAVGYSDDTARGAKIPTDRDAWHNDVKFVTD